MLDFIIDFLLMFIVVIISIVLHELAHGFVALLNGDKTAKESGRLTLNPLAHLDLLGLLMLFLCRFGYAKPVPVNPNNFKNRKTGMITVSLAGIVLNLLLAFICYPFVLLLYPYPYIYTFFVYMVVINLNLAIFNFLPLYPLDGYRLVNCFVPSSNKTMSFLRQNSRYILLILIALSFIRYVFSLPIYFDPLSWLIQWISGGIMRLYNLFWGIFI